MGSMAKSERAKGRRFLKVWMMQDLTVIPLDGAGVKVNLLGPETCGIEKQKSLSVQDILESNEELVKSEDYHAFRPLIGDGLINRYNSSL